MDEISRTLKNIVKDFDGPEMRAASASAAWKTGVGEELSHHTAFIELDKNRLFIAVSGEMWKKQLEKMSGRLVYLMNKELGNGSVNFIEFVVDPAKVTSEQKRDPDITRKNIERELRSALEVTPELKDAASTISNERLREVFLGAAAASLLRKRDRESN